MFKELFETKNEVTKQELKKFKKINTKRTNLSKRNAIDTLYYDKTNDSFYVPMDFGGLLVRNIGTLDDIKKEIKIGSIKV